MSGSLLSLRLLMLAAAFWLPALAGSLLLADEPLPEQQPAKTPADQADKIDFARDVRPILAAHCFECHGLEKQESGLRLDVTAALREGGNSGVAIVPGKSAESLLFKAVTSTGDEVSKMPPEGPPLSAAEIKTLRRWIDQGAEAPMDGIAAVAKPRSSDHWSFQPLSQAIPPNVKQIDWVRNPIDAFVLARLEAAGLQPAPQADRAALIRRLSLDLLGLPPTIAQVDTFLADTSREAYERLVDQLLSSPHYGERWGRHWLDVARYADSNGYTIDGGRSIWKYRDWVIDALNRDVPFDQFAIEQLAGDMLESPTPEQLIATGFHRNTMVNEEGGTDPEQFRVEAVVDRVSTTGSAFLGLTVGCARCHDHKYDPISQREFYQLFAIFNGADEPTLQVPTDQQTKEMPALLAEIAQSEKRLGEVDANSGSRQAEWEAKFAGRTADWHLLNITATSASGVQFARQQDGSLLASGTIPATDVYTLTAPLPTGSLTALRIEVLPDPSLPNQGPGWADNGNFVLSELAGQISNGTEAGGAGEGLAPLKFNEAWADHSGENGAVQDAIDGKPETGWNISAPTNANVARTAVFYFDNPQSTESVRQLTLSLAQNYRRPRYLLGRFRISISGGDREFLALPELVRQGLAIPAANRSEEQRTALQLEYRKIDPERVPLATRIDALKQQQKQMEARITTTLIMRERAEPRPTFVHVRGDFLQVGAAVQPGTPAVLPPLKPRAQRPDRLDFARWLVDSNNPLTPRVTVNRIWQTHFGQGLVATENDFGLQGDKPTHPELLDWLARAFIAERYSLKALHRLIVTSNTYRQSSAMRADLVAADPYNKLLGRQQRLRLEAETIRDAALAASGLLSDEIGGPGVYPPQPAGIYRFTQQVKFWGENKGADRYRRGMYTYLWRSSPYPFLRTFDAPDAVVACTRRPRSNTPLQALTLANDHSFFEMAQGFAADVLAQPEAEDTARLRLAFRRCFAREPSPTELTGLESYLQSQRAYFAGATDEAEQVASTNAKDVTQAAAWTMACRVLLNLDEFITRE